MASADEIENTAAAGARKRSSFSQVAPRKIPTSRPPPPPAEQRCHSIRDRHTCAASTLYGVTVAAVVLCVRTRCPRPWPSYSGRRPPPSSPQHDRSVARRRPPQSSRDTWPQLPIPCPLYFATLHVYHIARETTPVSWGGTSYTISQNTVCRVCC